MHFMRNESSRPGPKRRDRAVVLMAMAAVHGLVAWCVVTSTGTGPAQGGLGASYVQVVFPVTEKTALPPALAPGPPALRQAPPKARRTVTAAMPSAHAAIEASGDGSAPEEPTVAPVTAFDMGKALSEARRIGAEPQAGADRQREPFRSGSQGETALAKAVGQAHRADCRTAHSGDAKGNLFALIPLLKGTLSDKGCKW